MKTDETVACPSGYRPLIHGEMVQAGDFIVVPGHGFEPIDPAETACLVPFDATRHWPHFRRVVPIVETNTPKGQPEGKASNVARDPVNGPSSLERLWAEGDKLLRVTSELHDRFLESVAIAVSDREEKLARELLDAELSFTLTCYKRQCELILMDVVRSFQSASPIANPAHDPINHPAHYTGHPSGVECITIAEHYSFCRGNAMKYLWRAGDKGDAVEDLRKASWYLDREINLLNKMKGKL